MGYTLGQSTLQEGALHERPSLPVVPEGREQSPNRPKVKACERAFQARSLPRPSLRSRAQTQVPDVVSRSPATGRNSGSWPTRAGTLSSQCRELYLRHSETLPFQLPSGIRGPGWSSSARDDSTPYALITDTYWC